MRARIDAGCVRARMLSLQAVRGVLLRWGKTKGQLMMMLCRVCVCVCVIIGGWGPR